MKPLLLEFAFQFSFSLGTRECLLSGSACVCMCVCVETMLQSKADQTRQMKTKSKQDKPERRCLLMGKSRKEWRAWSGVCSVGGDKESVRGGGGYNWYSECETGTMLTYIIASRNRAHTHTTAARALFAIYLKKEIYKVDASLPLSPSFRLSSTASSLPLSRLLSDTAPVWSANMTFWHVAWFCF